MEKVSLANALHDTFEDANGILQAAMSDQSNIAQALKMAEADTVLGKDDEAKMEHLRWYAYPKECASLLTTSSLPVSVSNGCLVGAINPSREIKPQTICSERKRSNESMVANVEAVSTPQTVTYMFRDGEHIGEAPLEEIREGVDDGELSEACHIFDSETDQWILVSTFDRFNAKKMRMIYEKSKAPAIQVAVSIGPKKKDSRDSSAWGTGSVVTPTCVAPSTVQTGATGLPCKSSEAGKNKKHKHIRPPQKMMRLITQAMIQWNMIEEGDRLLLGLSGGKDSLSLLHALLEYRRKNPVKFDLEVCTIDPITPSFDPSPLIPYVESLGLTYHYIKDDIVSRAESSGEGGKTVKSLCAFCARMKRGNLYTCARKNNCNKLVLAQHLDDCAESFMMSVMHNGFLRTMKANYKINAGDISVIRPMVYCRESLMTEFAKKANLPIINENCPACFEEPKERARIKKMLSREETLYPNFFDNIRRSLMPLLHDDATAILRCYTEEAVARSRKHPKRSTAATLTTESTANTIASADLAVSLAGASEEDLIKELARRRAERYRLSGSMKRLSGEDMAMIPDPTGQICSLNGENGTIPCRELME